MKLLMPSLLILISLTACGVKGPPQPPMGDTPQESDRAKDEKVKKTVKKSPPANE